MVADDDSRKQTIMQKIFEHNPLTKLWERDDKQRFDGKMWKKPTSEDKWYDLRRNKHFSSYGIDPINRPTNVLAMDMRNL